MRHISQTNSSVIVYNKVDLLKFKMKFSDTINHIQLCNLTEI